MSAIVDYASLTAQIGSWTHKGALIAGSPPISDGFIQAAQEQIERDIPDLNFGNYIRFQENAYPPTAINTANGTTPVPTDWLGPKLLTVQDGSGESFPLLWKSAAWIYDRYPVRQACGLPAYVARDVITSGSFPVQSSYQTFTATGGQTVFSIAGTSVVSFVSLDGVLLVPGIDYTISLTTLTLTNGAIVGQTLYVQYLVSISGGIPTAAGSTALIFGPFPDSAYTVQGTYYQSAPLLNSGTTTNWMVLNAPTMLLAACMVEAAKFLEDDTMLGRWEPRYQQKLKALVDADKAERWGAATLQVEIA